MNDIAAIGFQVMQQDMSRLSRVADNIANVATPGFKRSVPLNVVTTGSFDSVLDASAPQATGLPVAIDVRPGTFKATGEKLDVALDGPGFLEVATPNGVLYTRQGNLRLDARGRIVTVQGYAVAGVGGDIVLKRADPAIDSNGNVREIGADGSLNVVGQLKVVDFAQPQVTDVGAGLFAANASAAPVRTGTIGIRQGYLENSNVNTMRETVDVIQTMRHFESMQKAMQSYDDMLGLAIRKLGDS